MFGREPVMAMALVQAAIALGTSFGLQLTGEQVGALTAFSAALLSFIVRSKVTPV